MTRTILTVLQERRAATEGIAIVALAFAMALLGTTALTSYAAQAQRSEANLVLGQEIDNRAAQYAAALNEDLVNPRTPSTARECSTTPVVCTAIIATNLTSATQQTLRIQADLADGIGHTITRDVVLNSADATHVTAIDSDGGNVWGLSNEGLRFRVWGVSVGKPTEVTAEELEGPKAGTTWLSVDDRAGVDSTGALWVWGPNDQGQAGIGSSSSTPAQPTKVSDDGATFRSVVTNDNRGYAIDSRGNLWVWGLNGSGQLGLGHRDNVNQPTQVQGLRVSKVAIGRDNVFAITTSGELMAAGAPQREYYPNIGPTFEDVAPGTSFKAVAGSIANGGYAAIRADGRLVVNGATTYAPEEKFIAVARGAATGYAISEAGDLYSWGRNDRGQAGRNNGGESPGFAKVDSALKFVAVQGTSTGALAIDVHGGLHYVGQLPAAYVGGPNLPRANVFTPLMPEMRFRQIASNDGDHAAALLDTSGNLYGLGTTEPGLWPFTYRGAGKEPIRMPLPDGFTTHSWN